MPRSTRDRVDQKLVNQQQTKEEVAKPRKTKKTRSLAKDYKADTPSVAPPDHTGSHEATTASEEEVVVALHDGLSELMTTETRQPVSAAVIPAENNLRDPFQYQSSYEVGVIIAFLPARSTHALRLVSKLWKASSEFHNAGLAIRTHFPNAAAASKTYETREEANLQFRRLCTIIIFPTVTLKTTDEGRLVYHQQSLQGGFATRAMECTSAKIWHLHGNALLWANPKGSISVHDLRSDKNIPNTASETIHLSLREHLDTEICLHDALLTSVGDLLIHLTQEVKSPKKYTPKLIRMSREGKIIWEVSHYYHDHIGRLAMGRSAFYYIFQPSRLRGYSFVASSIEDGSTFYHTVMTDRFLPSMDERYTFELFNHGRWASYRFLDGKTWIFDTATGKRVHYFEGSRYCSLVFSEAEDKFWEVDYRYENTWWRYVNTSDEDSKTLFRPELRYQRADLNTYDEKSGTFIHQRVWFRHASTRHTTGLGFGGDRKLCFRIEHSAQEPSRDGGSEDLFARMGIAPLAPDVDNSYPGAGEPLLVESGSVASVTLPVKSRNRATRRREFEASLPWKIHHGDFFGMVGDYLVFRNQNDESLVVLEFWPPW